MKTIGVDLWADQIRGSGNNNVTCLQPSSTARARRAFRELFITAKAAKLDDPESLLADVPASFPMP